MHSPGMHVDEMHDAEMYVSPALLDKIRRGLQIWCELGLMHRPSRLVLAGRGQPDSKIVARVAPVQLVVPVTCTSLNPELSVGKWSLRLSSAARILCATPKSMDCMRPHVVASPAEPQVTLGMPLHA